MTKPALGQESSARDQQNPEGPAGHRKAEIDKWWLLINAAGVTLE